MHFGGAARITTRLPVGQNLGGIADGTIDRAQGFGREALPSDRRHRPGGRTSAAPGQDIACHG